jgi:Fur family transcriptional regulator, ferric uptake regulator
MPPKETLHELLKREGHSFTQTRQRIFHTLMGQEPISMAQLTGRVRGVDRASVYRTIDLFERLGIVQRLYSGWKYKLELTDKFAPHHHHLTCTNCGRTIVLSEHELERFIEQLAHKHGFTPVGHQIEIQGLCTMCKQ